MHMLGTKVKNTHPCSFRSASLRFSIYQISITRKMLLVKFIGLPLWLLLSITYCAQARDVYGGGISAPNACFNGTIWQYSWCNPQPPPPSVYQSYGAPPPPQQPGYLPYGAPPPPPPPGFQSYGAPPPPAAAYGGNCPPTVVQCCEYPPPMPYNTQPNNTYSGALRTPSVIFGFLLFVFVFHV